MIKPLLFDEQVLDIGANIGYYTLLAAKLGQQVVAVEPVLDSIQRLHHAAYIEDVTERIAVVYNGIADAVSYTHLTLPTILRV